MLIFQPTRPLRGATIYFSRNLTTKSNFNPRAPCGARPAFPIARLAAQAISTHAPLAGRDLMVWPTAAAVRHFNPRAPCGARPSTFKTIFSARISTHAPLAGRDSGVLLHLNKCTAFQPTRPLRGATALFSVLFGMGVFQPTRPLRGATIMDWFGDTFFIISTHAPLAGRDGYWL